MPRKSADSLSPLGKGRLRKKRILLRGTQGLYFSTLRSGIWKVNVYEWMGEREAGRGRRRRGGERWGGGRGRKKGSGKRARETEIQTDRHPDLE